MIRLRIFSNWLQVYIPVEVKAQAKLLLKDIWRTEFDDKSYFVLELTDDSVKAFVEQVKLHPHILVYC
jgi:hypothetical protein